MAIKYLSGFYFLQYQISGKYQTIDVTSTGRVEGSTLKGGSKQAYTIGNYGVISGVFSSGHEYTAIDLNDGGVVYNLGTGQIAGSLGVEIMGGAARLVNQGTITAYYSDQGAELGAGTIVNAGAAAQIYGGVQIDDGPGAVANSGTINNYSLGGRPFFSGGYGVELLSSEGGRVNNTGSKALITAAGGIIVKGQGAVINSGTINGVEAAPGTGVKLQSGSVANAAKALIEGGYAGIGVYGGRGAVINHGTIEDTSIRPNPVVEGVQEFMLYGVGLAHGGLVSNVGTASLIEGYVGVQIQAAGTVRNSGTIESRPGERYRHQTGVALESGSIQNTGAGALIRGFIYGADIYGGAGFVSNSGSIESSYVGVRLDGGTLTNIGARALIEGGSQGVYDKGAGVLINTGTIDGVQAAAVYITGAAIVDNTGATAVIYGGSGAGGHALEFCDGVELRSTGAVFNDGTIKTGAAYRGSNASGGVYIYDSGSVNNNGAAALIEGYVGVEVRGAASVTNHGTIEGTGEFGALLGFYTTSSVTNSGTIEGSLIGLEFFDGELVNSGRTSLIEGRYGAYTTGEVVNFGTIASTAGAAGTALELGSSTSVLIDEAGSTFVGNVISKKGRLDLVGAGGTLNGLGVIFSGFSRVALQAGASWVFEGEAAVAPAITNVGTISVNSGSLDVTGSVIGSGLEVIGSAATLRFDKSVATQQRIGFAGTSGGNLVLDDPIGSSLRFNGVISGFGGADEIDLLTFQFGGHPTTTWSQNGSGGVLSVTDGVKAARIALFGQYSAAGFTVAVDSGTGTAISYSPPPQMMTVLPHA